MPVAEAVLGTIRDQISLHENMRSENAGPDDRLRVRELFETLVDLAPDERRARLDALALPGDVLALLQAMFDAACSPQPLLSLAAVDVVDRLRVDSDLIRGLIGSNVGPFHLLALIGEGGSSAVFRAERAAGSGAQTVALELLRTGLFSAEGQRRFRREQSILAQLTHPNIAAGVTVVSSFAVVGYSLIQVPTSATRSGGARGFSGQTLAAVGGRCE